MYKKYKILMLTTSMEYGGAETHISELAKYLKANQTREVKIVSNSNPDDLFVKEITESGLGIEHFFAPFHSRNILNIRKSKKILSGLIKSYRPDIIHAHSRIPAFIASGLCRKYKIPLVTTIHGTYKMSPLLKLATNWGDYSLYVSEDIKYYWQKYYKFKPGYMTKTVNGINIDLFKPEETTPSGGQAACHPSAEGNFPATSGFCSPFPSVEGCRPQTAGWSSSASIKQEFNIKPEEKIIFTIGRLENRGGFNLAFTALKLCGIAEEIYNQDKNTRIIITGGGDLFGEIKAKADYINEKLGFDYIILTGRRGDAYKFFRECSVFVGISRSSLEALACGKPVILAGETGYLGIFNPENADKCEETNFTCRGYTHPENLDNILIDDILYCLSEENHEVIKNNSDFGVNLIRNKYSVKKMAEDVYNIYQKAVLKYKNYDFVLSGYYGYGNIGDDVLLFSVISNILNKKPDLKICLLTKNPGKLQKSFDEAFCNIEVKQRFNFLGVKRALKKSRALVFGGGTLLQDSTSGRSFGYYAWLLQTAQKLGKKTILYSNGIGPVSREKNRRKAAEIAKNITLATIRDEDSYNYLIKLGINQDKIYLTADEALNNYFSPREKDFREDIIVGRGDPDAPQNQTPAGDYIVISIRKWKHIGSDFFRLFSEAINLICGEHNLIPVYIVMESKNDRLLSERLSKLNSGAYFINNDKNNNKENIEKILTVIKSAKAVISMRLHTLIFAAEFGVPMLGISYDPKVKSFLNSIFKNKDCNYCVELKDFNKNQLAGKFRLLTSNREEIKEQINYAAEDLRRKAESNAELFLTAIEEG
ncbi:MAG: polysaccharide pyruvyl transferase CsaB [Oscillospiraceae bacterium]|nr:polysaccharide pyruvyl transferase CsaB [Oscillospiraceae bacterium]